jgi:hypothetical protein
MAELDSGAVLGLLSRLHERKNAGYGNAWRKRGELLSIYTNLARKYDRLIVALDEGNQSTDERILDTAGDLCVYAAKYLTWLAEQHPIEFNSASSVDAKDCADDGSSDSLDRVLAAVHMSRSGDVSTAWNELKISFEALDQGLIAQSEGEPALAWERKVDLAWEIAGCSAGLLLCLAEEDEEALEQWRGELEVMG